VDRMKQEEDKKIASMEPFDYSRPSELEQVVEEEEEFYVDTQSDDASEDVEEHGIVTDHGSSQIVHIKRSSPISGSDVNVNVSVNVKAPNRSLQPARSSSSMSSSSSVGSVRTAKAEKRFKEKLTKEVICHLNFTSLFHTGYDKVIFVSLLRVSILIHVDRNLNSPLPSNSR